MRIIPIGIGTGVLISLSMASLFCRSSLHKNPWPQVKPVLVYGFRVYPDPQIKTAWHRIIEKKALVRDKMAALYFPLYNTKNTPITLVLYDTEKLYSRHSFFRSHPMVRSYFVRSAHALHITLAAPQSVWIHEFSHALLHAVRPDTPRWLHEGLASFLEQRKRLGSRHCGDLQKVKLPHAMQKRAPSYARADVLGLFTRRKRGRNNMQNYRYYDLSTLMIYYLWNQRQLSQISIGIPKKQKTSRKTLGYAIEGR